MANKSTVISQPRTKPPWILTQEAMDLLLARLHPDRELAGQAYQELRWKVTVFFEGRRCAFPEDLADETLNRIARKIWEGEQIVDVDRYALTVARYIFKESQRLPVRASLSLDDLLQDYDFKISQNAECASADEAEDERRKECMRRCLLTLSAEQRELLVEYYQGEKRAKIDHRKEMAERLGMSPNALYLHIHRLREKLHACFEKCLAQS